VNGRSQEYINSPWIQGTDIDTMIRAHTTQGAQYLSMISIMHSQFGSRNAGLYAPNHHM
jgi:hypothetical protein